MKQRERSEVRERDLPIQRLYELFHLDCETGDLRWKVSLNRRIKIGSLAGSSSTNKRYSSIQINGRKYKNHRIIYAMTTGEWPVGEIDHRNGKPGINRPNNLRDTTHVNNMYNGNKRSNNTSGYIGVCWHKPNKKWLSYISINGRRKHLGIFSDKLEACFNI